MSSALSNAEVVVRNSGRRGIENSHVRQIERSRNDSSVGTLPTTSLHMAREDRGVRRESINSPNSPSAHQEVLDWRAIASRPKEQILQNVGDMSSSKEGQPHTDVPGSL